MDVIWEELTSGLGDVRQLVHVLVRLLAATLLGAVIGIQRERAGKPAGLRTHMLVTLGTAVFVLACAGVGMSSDGLSRVIQGIITGIGFIGAGSILKLSEERDVRGLTTAAGVWMTLYVLSEMRDGERFGARVLPALRAVPARRQAGDRWARGRGAGRGQ
ncbi:MAG: MgtC/SapB family protein [Acidobacteria bacterium]|nr:MgtC/SapB family protein [Acidobacteriota bacterium]